MEKRLIGACNIRIANQRAMRALPCQALPCACNEGVLCECERCTLLCSCAKTRGAVAASDLDDTTSVAVRRDLVDVSDDHLHFRTIPARCGTQCDALSYGTRYRVPWRPTRHDIPRDMVSHDIGGCAECRPCVQTLVQRCLTMHTVEAAPHRMCVCDASTGQGMGGFRHPRCRAWEG